MKEIRGLAKNIRSLLSGAKFAIDYYQREYRWETKQVNKAYPLFYYHGSPHRTSLVRRIFERIRR